MKNLVDPVQMKQWFHGTFAIVILAMKIPFRNPNFITFTLITSIPLFFITLIPELPHVQNQLTHLFIEAFVKREILTKQTLKTIAVDLSWAVELEPIIQFLKFYTVGLVNFLTALATIHASSTIHTSNGDHRASVCLRDLLKSTITKTQTRLRDAVFTFIAMSIFYIVSLPCVIYSIHNQQRLHIDGSVRVVVHAVTFAIWVECNAWWMLSVVVYILELEEQRGFQAFSTSLRLMKGNILRGFFLLLLLSVRIRSSGWITSPHRGWCVPRRHIAYAFLHATVSCLEKVMTWMIFTVYYFNCKNRQQKRS